MKKKKLKLRNWVKVVMVCTIMITMGLILVDSFTNFDEMARKCDMKKGYTCSYYEIRNYRGE